MKNKAVVALVVGDQVDLSTCPYLKNNPLAKFEYARVAYVLQETPECVVIGYEGIDPVGYPVETELGVRA